ncbi:hypothetical protein BX281_1695 [Streptomyces sp. Ag82_O1-15]|nr:hypothetical protein BX281_1695 [Streptomyces sp. Ag82_O1-15]
MGLRAGSFGLGAMWAVVSGAERRQVTAFVRIAHGVAVHLMRRRTEDYRTHRVDPSERAIARSRLEHGLALMQRSRDLTVHARQSPSLWYLVLTVGRPQENSAATVRDWLRDLLDGGTGDRMPSYAVVGSAADNRDGLPRSRKEAERAPAVARRAAVAHPSEHPALPTDEDRTDRRYQSRRSRHQAHARPPAQGTRPRLPHPSRATSPSTSENAARSGRNAPDFHPPFPDMRGLRLSYGSLKSWWPEGELVMMGA